MPTCSMQLSPCTERSCASFVFAQSPATSSDNAATAPVAEKPAPKPKPKAGRDDDDSGERVRTAENAVFVELAGSAFLYSVNLEHLFGDSGSAPEGA